MADWGIKTSKKNYDARTASLENLTMTSKVNTLKTFGIYDATVNGSHFTHNLGYVPIFLYVGFLSIKSPNVSLFGQQGADDLTTNVVVTTTEASNDSNSGFAGNALVYLFYDQLI